MKKATRNPLQDLSLADKAKAWKETDLTKSSAERSQAAKRTRRADDAERVQVEVTRGVGYLLDEIAGMMNTTRSAVAEYLLMVGMFEGKPEELRRMLVPARSPRYEFKLERQSLDDWRMSFAKFVAQMPEKDAG